MKTDDGFSLLEVLIALTLFTVGVGALAQLSLIAMQANHRAKVITMASILAQQKMAQLHALTWRFDPLGVAMSDDASDTTVTPEAPFGGMGLRSSPAASLTTNVAGYCDFVDLSGRLLGGEARGSVPASAMYIRRWAVAPLAGYPDTLAIQVLVTTISPERPGESARLVSVRTRRGT